LPLLACGTVGTPERRQVLVPLLAGDLQPALLLNEGDEHQPVEEALGEEASPFVVGTEPADTRLDRLEDTPVLPVKRLGDDFDVKRVVVTALDLQRRLGQARQLVVLKRDQSQPLTDGAEPIAEALVGTDRVAAQDATPRAVVVVLDVDESP